jgi:apolipoprotein N-acyltransferase
MIDVATKSADANASPSLARVLVLSVIAIVCFQLAYSIPSCAFLMAGFLFCIYELTTIRSTRLILYGGLLLGLLVYAPQLSFFWTIFGPTAIGLWLILAFWLVLFLVIARFCRRQFGAVAAVVLIPFVWTGLEYFRSELYYLRFSWMNAGYAFSGNAPSEVFRFFGMYGIGFLLMAAVSFTGLLRGRRQILTRFALLVLLALIVDLPLIMVRAHLESHGGIGVAGAQMEFPSDRTAVTQLDRLLAQYPLAQLFVLSEYTFDGPVPDVIKAWCKENQRYLIAGGKAAAEGSQYYNTAFVIGPTGEIVFQQAKSVPIQFFKDGLPAREQKLWNSPWGRIGICICYDLSYTRVTDQLIRLGAQAIIVPTMDVSDWGRHQHELHARVALVRAAEYGIPIFRVASSGISQSVNRMGRVLQSAPFPGEGEMICTLVDLRWTGSLPLDRYLAPFAVCVTLGVVLWVPVVGLRRRKGCNKQVAEVRPKQMV